MVYYIIHQILREQIGIVWIIKLKKVWRVW